MAQAAAGPDYGPARSSYAVTARDLAVETTITKSNAYKGNLPVNMYKIAGWVGMALALVDIFVTVP